MAVLIHSRGKEGTPDLCEEAVCWSMGPLTVKLWADEERTSLLCEFSMGEVTRLEFPETKLKKWQPPKPKELGKDLINDESS